MINFAWTCGQLASRSEKKTNLNSSVHINQSVLVLPELDDTSIWWRLVLHQNVYFTMSYAGIEKYIRKGETKQYVAPSDTREHLS